MMHDPASHHQQPSQIHHVHNSKAATNDDGSITPAPPPLNNDTMFLMVDPCMVPNTLGPEIHVFDLHDELVVDANIVIRHIMGYCLPMRDDCVSVFKNNHPWRAIKLVDPQTNDEQFMRKYKLQSSPLRVAPLHDTEFLKMIRSSPAPLCNSSEPLKTLFYVRPGSPGPDQQQNRSPFDDTAMHFVHEKFKLHMNPHLIAFRMPDGLNCYIRLELAQHCQHEYTQEDQQLPYAANHHHHHHHNNNQDQHQTNNHHRNNSRSNCRGMRQNSFRDDQTQQQEPIRVLEPMGVMMTATTSKEAIASMTEPGMDKQQKEPKMMTYAEAAKRKGAKEPKGNASSPSPVAAAQVQDSNSSRQADEPGGGGDSELSTPQQQQQNSANGSPQTPVSPASSLPFSYAQIVRRRPRERNERRSC